MDITFLILAVLSVFFLIHLFGQKHVPDETVNLFTGGLGTGKTFLAVKYALRRYRRNMRAYYLEKITFGLLKSGFPEKPRIFSNIPVRVWFNRWAEALTYEHLIQTERLPEKAVLIIDEIGSIFDQYSFDNPVVRQYFEPFLRFFRHFIGGHIYGTDQNSSNIVVSARRRINTIYNLSHFRRWFLFFYKVDVQEIQYTEDMITVQDTTKMDELPYFFGFLPFKFLRLFGIKPRYDSRCYSVKYKAPVVNDRLVWSEYKTEYAIEIPDNRDMRKEYKTNGFIPRAKIQEYIDAWKTRPVDSVPSDSTEKSDD